jgi:hypothetical protein
VFRSDAVLVCFPFCVLGRVQASTSGGRGSVMAHGRQSWRARRWRNGRCFTGPARRSKSGATADLDLLLDEEARVSMFQSGEPGTVEPHGNGYRARVSIMSENTRGPTRATQQEAESDLVKLRCVYYQTVAEYKRDSD